jgi:hypothetical protein
VTDYAVEFFNIKQIQTYHASDLENDGQVNQSMARFYESELSRSVSSHFCKRRSEHK